MSHHISSVEIKLHFVFESLSIAPIHFLVRCQNNFIFIILFILHLNEIALILHFKLLDESYWKYLNSISITLLFLLQISNFFKRLSLIYHLTFSTCSIYIYFSALFLKLFECQHLTFKFCFDTIHQFKDFLHLMHHELVFPSKFTSYLDIMTM